MSETRIGTARRTAWLGVIGNLALSGVKGTVGLLSGSKALVADAVSSAMDATNSFSALMGLGIVRKPGENESKAATMATIVIAVLLIVLAVQIGKSSIDDLRAGVHQPPAKIAWIVLVGSILLKKFYSSHQDRLVATSSGFRIMRTARDIRTDHLASVIALTGILAAWAGDWTDLAFMYVFDPVASILIAILVLRMAWKLIWQSLHHSDVHDVHDEDALGLVQTVQRIKGIITVDNLRAREHGHYVVVDVKISVNPKITVAEGHEIAKLTKQHLMKRFSHVSDVMVHVNPYDPGYPYKSYDDPEQDELPTLLH